MAYTTLRSFDRGLDARRLLDCLEPGTLINAKDCHITVGGEIEKRAAFVDVATLPAGTIGFYATDDPITFHTWGTAATPPAGMPANGQYHAVPHPDGVALADINSVEEFSGKLYVVAQYANGDIIHWYREDDTQGDKPIVTPPPKTPDTGTGGEPATEPPSGGPGGVKPQTTFKCSFIDGSLGGTLRKFYLVSPTGEQIALIDIPVEEPPPPPPSIGIENGGDGAGHWIAAQMMDLINSTISVPDAAALANDDTLQVWIEDASTKYNGYTIFIGSSNLRFQGGGPLSGGVNPAPPAGMRSGQVFDPRFVYGEVGAPRQLGTFALAHDGKMYSVDGSLLRFSGTAAATLWENAEASSAGAIDHTMVTGGTPQLVSLADYGGELAVFGKRHIFVYQMDPLPENNKRRQTLHNTGTIAPHSVTPYGSSDVMYLDRSGIRSLRARDSSNTAYASDIGTLIDPLVRDQIIAHSDGVVNHNFWGEVEPKSGRLWMAFRDKCFVLSHFPGTTIAAWTWYDMSTCPVDMLNATHDFIFWRSGDRVIAYGGLNEALTYDATEAIARLPYIDAGKAGTTKAWLAIDLALYGTWQIHASFDATAPTTLDLLANLTKSTYAQQKIAMNGESPSVSLELRSNFVGPSRLGNATVHFDDAYAD